MNRDLDGIYFRVKRNDKFQPVCFTDLTEDEIEELMGDKDAQWWKAIALELKRVINAIGEQFDIVSSTIDEE